MHFLKLLGNRDQYALMGDVFISILTFIYLQTDVELFYKFSPLLIQYTPVETVSAWIKQGSKLEAKRLIPALVQYEHEKYREQVQYIFFQL